MGVDIYPHFTPRPAHVAVGRLYALQGSRLLRRPGTIQAQDGQNDAEHEGGVAEPVESKVRGVEWLEPAATEASETAGRS